MSSSHIKATKRSTRKLPEQRAGGPAAGAGRSRLPHGPCHPSRRRLLARGGDLLGGRPGAGKGKIKLASDLWERESRTAVTPGPSCQHESDEKKEQKRRSKHSGGTRTKNAKSHRKSRTVTGKETARRKPSMSLQLFHKE